MNPSNTTQAVARTEDKMMEYIPFGGQDKIKLSIAMVKNLIAVKTKSGKTCSDTDAIKFVALCQARRLNPFEGDCFLIGYDGNTCPKCPPWAKYPEFGGQTTWTCIDKEP